MNQRPPAPRRHTVPLFASATCILLATVLALATSVVHAEQRLGQTRFYSEGQFAVQGVYNTDADQAFGNAIAIGDFDGDGVDDVAVSSPFENTACCFGAGGPGEGVVRVAYGFASVAPLGNTAWHSQMINLYAVSGVVSQPGAHFGKSLHVIDLDNDGYDDLLIGAPDFDVSYAGSSRADAGAIFIVWGSAAGLESTEALTFTRNSFAAGEPMAGDHFGHAISGQYYGSCTAVPSQFNALVVGIPGAEVNGHADAGMIVAGRHFARSASFAHATTITQDDYPSSVSHAEDGDEFGFSLTSWAYNTIWAGSPGEAVNGSGADAGAVFKLAAECVDGEYRVAPRFDTSAMPDPDGVAYRGHRSRWSCLGICEYEDFNGTPTAGDRFGESIVLGRGSNLIVGAPGAFGTGAVFFEGLVGAHDSFTHPAASVYNGSLPTGAKLGASLVRIDLDGDLVDDIVAGAPGVGEVHGRLLYPWSTALPNPSGQSPEFLKIASDRGAGMGAALARLSSPSGGPDMLLVGEPGWDQLLPAAINDAGRLRVYVSSQSLDTQVDGSGSIVSDEGDIDCSGSCRAILPQDQTRHLSAIAGQYHVFAGWNGDCSGGVASCEVSLTGEDKTVRATFSRRVDTLDVALSGPMDGSVVAYIAGAERIDCQRSSGINSGSCSALATAGSVVGLAATPQSGARAIWISAPCDSNGAGFACDYGPLDGNDAVAVEFVLNSLRRIAFVGAPRQGEVSSHDGQILDCRNPATDACIAYYPAGSTVTLTATPDPDQHFDGWQGDLASLCGSSNPCAFTIGEDLNRAAVLFAGDSASTTGESIFTDSFESPSFVEMPTPIEETP